MYKRIACCIVVSLCLFSCSKNKQLEGYSRDITGYYFKLLGIGDGNAMPGKDEVVVADAVMRTQSDSVFWDTQHDAANGLYIDLNADNIPGSCHKQLLQLVEGDSASFWVKPSVFFRVYFDTVVPVFCKNDSLIRIDIKVNQIISKYEFAAIKEGMQSGHIEDTELEELQLIESYLLNNDKQLKPDAFGIYRLEKNSTNNENVTLGKRVKIAFQGSFIDGRPLDATMHELEFIYGTPDQLIKGLNIVIGSLKKGETAKIIVPSRLAFGEQGSSNGSIPPYTPLVYNVKIIDIK